MSLSLVRKISLRRVHFTGNQIWFMFINDAGHSVRWAGKYFVGNSNHFNSANYKPYVKTCMLIAYDGTVQGIMVPFGHSDYVMVMCLPTVHWE